MKWLLHRAGNVSSSSQAYRLQHTDTDTPQQQTASHACSPAASPEAEADSSGHGAAPGNTTVTADIIVASAAHVPQVSSKCVMESAVFPCATLACLQVAISFLQDMLEYQLWWRPQCVLTLPCVSTCQVDNVKMMLCDSDSIPLYELFQGGP